MMTIKEKSGTLQSTGHEINKINYTTFTSIEEKKSQLAEMRKVRGELSKAINHLEEEIKKSTFSQSEADMWEEFYSGCTDRQIEQAIQKNTHLFNTTGDCFNLQILSGAQAARNKRKSLEGIAA